MALAASTSQAGEPPGCFSRGRRPGCRGRSTRLAALVSLLVAALALAGCQSAPSGAAPASQPAAASGSSPATAGSGAAAGAPAASAPTTTEPVRALKIGYAANNPRVSPLWIAEEQGFFRRNGLDTEIIFMRSAPTLQAAMLAREIQIGQTGYIGTVQARAGGSDVVQFGGVSDKPIAFMVANPSIRTPQELRGKKIGITAIGGAVWGRAVMALQKFGLDVQRDDITFVGLGDETLLAQAVLAGAVDATPLGTSHAVMLRQQGFNTWDLAELGVAEMGQAFVVTEAFQQAEPIVVERFLRGMAEAVHFMKGMPNDPARRTLVLETTARYMRVNPDEVAQEVDAYVPQIPANLRMSVDAMQQLYDLGVSENPALARIPLQATYDERILERLERDGYFRQLYATP
jgi:NitT/TauT family transport system substrate-binding protein